jgi:hypothetical protein
MESRLGQVGHRTQSIEGAMLMGMRYDFELTVNIKEETPENIIRVLAYLMTDEAELPAGAPPDDPFFSEQWAENRFAAWARSCDPHAGDTICSFRRVYRYTHQGVEHYQHTLHLRLSGKLEPIFEVALPFAMWLATWSDQNECVGSYKGEDSRHPTLLYFHDAKLYARDVEEPPESVLDGTQWK